MLTPTVTKPEDSWAAFDDMVAVSEEFYQSLGLPYRVVGIVSGALSMLTSSNHGAVCPDHVTDAW